MEGITVEWKDLIRPSTVNLILGYKGMGKSGLAYYLMEKLAPEYELLPVVVNFPTEKQDLLPPGYTIMQLEDALLVEDAFVLVDEGTTQLPAGAVLEEFIKACSSLSRQRRQIFLFIFHASRDVGSRIMRGLDTIIVKQPSRRQIEQGAKDRWFKVLLEDAKQAIRAQDGDPREWAYVDSDSPEFRGVLRNPLPSFWTPGLSEAWRGVTTSPLAALARYMSALQAIERFESYYAMAQYPDGWSAEDVALAPSVLAELVKFEMLEERSPGRYWTTGPGRQACLDTKQRR